MSLPPALSTKLFKIALALGIASFLSMLVNALIFFDKVKIFSKITIEDIFNLVALQFFLGFLSAFFSVIQFVRTKGLAGRGWTIALAVAVTLVGFGGTFGLFVIALVSSLGGAWGRPLRVRGKILHPSLRQGSDWTRGARPDVGELDAATRTALEALWLHDAQKEHASVPAFSRISWMLAAVGAPAELLEGAHQAAMEEIDHTRRCFALAAGYGGRSHSVEAMPDLLLGGLDIKGDPLVYLAVESLKDGCLLEDFNADVAGACEAACQDPATGDVLARIAREERSHADFSWQCLGWLLDRGGAKVRRAVEEAIAALPNVPRPTAADSLKQVLVDRADPAALRAHGRLPDAEWAALWTLRLGATRERALALLAAEPQRAAA